MTKKKKNRLKKKESEKKKNSNGKEKKIFLLVQYGKLMNFFGLYTETVGERLFIGPYLTQRQWNIKKSPTKASVMTQDSCSTEESLPLATSQ